MVILMTLFITMYPQESVGRGAQIQNFPLCDIIHNSIVANETILLIYIELDFLEIDEVIRARSCMHVSRSHWHDGQTLTDIPFLQGQQSGHMHAARIACMYYTLYT